MRDALESGASKTGRPAASARATLVVRWRQPDYFDLVDSRIRSKPLERLRPGAFVIGAARFGTTRLLDNLWIKS